jgi:hypothetical protein
MQSLLMHILCKGEYLKMALSVMHINKKIHNQQGSKWPLEFEKHATSISFFLALSSSNLAN